MSEEKLNEIEIDDPMSPNDLLANLTQDLILNADANNVATEFMDEFVLRDRPEETSQILVMLEMPAESLAEMMKGVLGQAYQTQLQAVDNNGVRYFENLKAAVKKQMLELAE
jgi:hypothetical protein